MKEWYAKHLGFVLDPYGVKFGWKQEGDQPVTGYTLWAPFSADTKYFAPSQSEFMINYIVDDLEALVKALKEEGVTVLDELAVYEYGKFVHILDPEGNKLELFEPARES